MDLLGEEIMFKEKNKIRVFIYTSMILAFLLGGYGQDISEYCKSHMGAPSYIHYLTVATILSILLFIIPPILIYKLNKKKVLGELEFVIYYLINGFIGIMTSLFSLFALAMSYN